MRKEVEFKNRDRFIQLGVAIAALRKLRGLSQEKLPEKAGISRSLLSIIEAPGMAHGFSLEVFFNIADALEIDPADLINASVFPNEIIIHTTGKNVINSIKLYLKINYLAFFRLLTFRGINQKLPLTTLPPPILTHCTPRGLKLYS